MVGGAAALLSAGGARAATLAGLLAAFAAYGALARRLPTLPSPDLDVAFIAAVLLPAAAAAIWLALPLVSLRSAHVLALAAAAGGLAVALSLAGAGSAANVAKLSCYALLGLWFAGLFEHTWWVGVVAALVPWVDIWSVAAGPTQHIVEERPGLFLHVAVVLDAPGAGAGIGIGPPDVLFFACFLGAARRFSLRVRATWLAMTALLAATLALVWLWQPAAGLPALPAVCLGFLLANADLLWRSLRAHRRARAGGAA
ncbi:MAG TPA: hypothetical protein VNJ46_00480 [Gaiellaceae bacterium]|nr:hypothetical protein [Gaiellaceae bacterium]